ncbi:hypothetical protein SMD44_08651 [Streptomyces alboflavus]|uniref:Uncharacterized protein n=1 Tax=Streptomyces alboflavus TaxID=67267 RepID=A0A1Z1WRZ6_9ACTN|nr:hypothetical protein [Streptomyces alboflavus]ARX89164.1 hypothetical protein SMD44_08651 [Streptomyces alboflavus]
MLGRAEQLLQEPSVEQVRVAAAAAGLAVAVQGEVARARVQPGASVWARIVLRLCE